MFPTRAATSGDFPGQGAGALWRTSSLLPSSLLAGGMGVGESQPVDDALHPGMRSIGAVRIAPRVLRTVVEQAVLSVPGVARLGHVPANRLGPWRLPLSREQLPYHGVALRISGDEVSADLYVLADPSAHLVEVGAAVQEAVGGTVEHILGMRVREVNVYIQDVA